MRGLPFVLTLLFVSLAFAGCSGKDAPAPSEDAAVDDLDLSAGETTGVIRGVVVDEAIQPIAGATVTLIGTEQSTTSNDQGAFGFSDLEPGDYFVQATKTGFSAAQQSVQVEAGVLDPPAVKLLLIRDLANTPFYQETVFQGFMECGTPVIAACSAPNVAVQITDLILNETIGQKSGLGNVTNDQFIHWIVVDQAPEFIQSELVWESTQAISDQLTLDHSYSGKDNVGIMGTFNAVTGTSPLVLRSTAEQAASVGIGPETNLVPRVFSGPAQGDPTGLVGVTIQQKFQVFTHVFFHFVPDEGWQFSVDGEPAVPS